MARSARERAGSGTRSLRVSLTDLIPHATPDEVFGKDKGETGMRIAIIGAGNVGKALGRRLATARHDILYGGRVPMGRGSGAMTALEVRDLAHAYRRKALDGVNLSVEAGEFVVLLGLNGAGKTTLFSLIAGFLN